MATADLEAELEALAIVGRQLEPLDQRTRQRVLDWLWDKAVEQPQRDARRHREFADAMAEALRPRIVRLEVAEVYEEVFGGRRA